MSARGQWMWGWVGTFDQKIQIFVYYKKDVVLEEYGVKYNNEKYNSDSYFIFSVFIKMNFGEMYEINVRTREDVDVLNDNIKKNNEYESESCKIFVSQSSRRIEE